jgi:WD40 repeat protein/predicted Ser/Thr protein kinase
MADDRLEQAWVVFDELAEVPAADRESVLRAACGDDAALRAEVERLLALDDRLASEGAQAGFLQSPLVRDEGRTETLAAFHPSSFIPHPSIGSYRILRLLGEGGMGSVYEAEQDSPNRTVALKVIRPGLLAPALLKRFAQEVEILGRLRHPGIAQIYEAGLAQDGQPFFAMELIRGLPLDEYARQRSPALGAQLELVARVCDAVQHAHEQGVIHRDLKPANIVVEETGQPRVLDFGVARATDADLLTTTARTQAGQMLGTLSYMSPEQVTGDPTALDARSDVYALGVILFELLAHRLPYPLHNLPLPEAARVIREQEPSRLGSIDTACRGDVETIVAKALEKDKARRYDSAGELAADLRRHMQHEPIAARPASAWYQMRKFARRNKAPVAGVLGVFAALLVGTMVSVLFAVRAAENAAVAQQEGREATYQAYRARIAAAVAALQHQDVAVAARQLEAAPVNLRGWEWRHLSSRLDDSSAVAHLRPGDPALLLSAPQCQRVEAVMGAPFRSWDGSGTELPRRTFPSLGVGWFTLAGPAPGWLLAITQESRLVTLLDQAGRVVCTIKPRQGKASQIALNPDQTQAAVGLFLEDGPYRIGLFDTSSGQERASWAADREGLVLALAFSPDGRRLASAGDDHIIHIWDAADGQPVCECRGHTSKVMSVAFRQDGTRLVTAGHDGSVRQWDARSGREVEPPYDRHAAETLAAIYSPDGKRVASAGADGAVRLWRADGRQDQAVLRGHTGAVVALAFSSDGRRLASASYEHETYQGDGTIRFWEAAPEVALPVLAGHESYVYPVAYSPDGRWIASGSWDHTIRLWDAATGEACATLPHSAIVKALAFTPDGARLVSGGDPSGEPLVWDLSTGRVQGRMASGVNLRGSVAVRPDGARIASFPCDTKDGVAMSIADLATGRVVGAESGCPFAFSPDGKWLAGKDVDGKTIVLWDAHTFRPVARWPGHTGEINAVAFDREGGRLVSASSDHTVRMWDVATGQCLRVFEGHTDEVFSAVFHPDGARIASGGRDRSVWLWDVASGQEVARLPGHSSYIWSLAFSPDGKTLVSGSGDSTVRLWDTEPLRVRYQARREHAALRPEAERLVEQLWRQKDDAAAVAAALRADGALSEPLRQAALRAVLRRARPPEAAAHLPGPP